MPEMLAAGVAEIAGGSGLFLGSLFLGLAGWSGQMI